MSNAKNFRKDINGLRALAVIAVIIFHFNKEWLNGGFAGVDVFFVISGFLMTTIIFSRIEKQTFDLWGFYKARAKRIVPALTILVFTLLIFGYIALPPDGYKTLGKHAYQALLFVSNFQFARETGYFDVGSLNKFLLHTWSLSVEWQFYILYPIVIGILARFFSLKKIKALFIIAFFILLAISLFTSFNNPNKAYFMLYSRAWEMMLGGLVFLFPINFNSIAKRSVEILGIIIILISFFIIQESMPWPGYMALIPTIGTALVLVANHQKSLLSNIVFQTIGLWSYSMYLVHWALIVMLYQLDIKIPFYAFLVLVLFLSFMLYRMVERRRNFAYKTLAFYFIVLIAAFAVKETDGLPFRMQANSLLSATDFHQKYFGGNGASGLGSVEYFNKDKNDKIIITGDSFSRQYMSYLISSGISIEAIITDGCFSAPDYRSYDYHLNKEINDLCINRFAKFEELLKKSDAKVILYAQNWGNSHFQDNTYSRDKNEKVDYKNILEGQIDKIIKLLKPDQTLILIGEQQGTDINVQQCAAKRELLINHILDKYENCTAPQPQKELIFNKLLAEIAKKNKNVIFFNPNDYLCKDGVCLVTLNDGNFVYSDLGHFSIYGSSMVGQHIIDLVKQLYKQ